MFFSKFCPKKKSITDRIPIYPIFLFISDLRYFFSIDKENLASSRPEELITDLKGGAPSETDAKGYLIYAAYKRHIHHTGGVCQKVLLAGDCKSRPHEAAPFRERTIPQMKGWMNGFVSQL